MENKFTYTTAVPNFVFYMLYENKETGFSVERSSRGYNPWAKWFVKQNGKILASCENKDEAFTQSRCLFWEHVSTKLLEKKRAGAFK